MKKKICKLLPIFSITFLFFISSTHALPIHPFDSKPASAGRAVLNYFTSIYHSVLFTAGKFPVFSSVGEMSAESDPSDQNSANPGCGLFDSVNSGCDALNPVDPDQVDGETNDPNPSDFKTGSVTTPLKDGDRILWVGNSLSDWNGPMDKCLKAIFAAQTDPINIEIKTIIKGSTGIDTFAGDASLGVVDAIRTGDYDLFVMQTSSEAWDTGQFNLDNTVSAAKLLSSEADRAGSQTAVFFPQLWSWTWDCAYPELTNTDCQWPGKDGEYMPIAIATHRRIADETGAMIMPAGIAWEKGALTYAAEHGGNFDAFVGALYHDKVHQNPNGMILNAFVCYTMLSGGKSPVGLKPQWPNAIAASDAYRPDLQDYLAQIAYKTAMEAMKN